MDWRQIAEDNNLTPEEFKHEIFMAAGALGAMAIDADNADAMIFTSSDEVGPLTVTVCRKVKEEA